MIPGLPSPWIILGVVLALLGAYLGGDIHGVHSERLAWTAKEQKQIADNEKAARATEHEWADYSAKIEGNYFDAQAKSDDLARRLAAAMSGGVRIKGACKPQLPGTAASAGVPDTTTAADGILPPDIGRRLFDAAVEAERVLRIARAGEDHAAVKVPK